MVGAVAPPAVEGGMGLSKEWAFCIVGLFFGLYFIGAQLYLVCNLKERTESRRQETVPMVCGMTRALRNKPFAILLFAIFLE